jgi:lysophospholipase L1-like esterase
MNARSLTLTLIAATAALTAAAAPSAVRNGGPPESIAAIGDSITSGACTDSSCADRPANSWSTGANPTVNSHRRRLDAILKKIKGSSPVRAYNFATSGHITMADLAGQAQQAVAVRAEYVTIELGENDLCGTTTPNTFRAQLQQGLTVLSKGLPGTKILLLSIEDLTRHWQILQTDPKAATAFKAGASIDCGLARGLISPTLLNRIRKRTTTLNQILADVCSQHPLCLYDAGTYYRLPLKAAYFSPADYQHLSLAGQHALAAAEWKAAQRVLWY